ncbi:signal peptidase II [Plantactinospora sp. KBS50]|uniref:signal peptidase II n=1 Tax=Plantactinospora sp. KBS50 TaxID=2024580 RepID=UPI000BAADE16|nr:signal peptidase II [Plantactinospora sp. KBS50]ASW56012.1 signal peptidase II [Plantactinospora sp. KBS50]
MTEARPVRPDTDPQPSARRHRRAVFVLILTAVAALAADLATKQWALSELTPGEPVRLLGGALWLSLIRNSGAAWSLGADHTWVFPLVTLAVIGWIGWMAGRLRSVPWAVSLGLVLGGALGNFVDRVFRAPGVFLGHVVDMISVFGPYGQHFPVFNLADSSLFCGVVLAVLLELTGHRRDGVTPRAGLAGDGPAGTAGEGA